MDTYRYGGNVYCIANLSVRGIEAAGRIELPSGRGGVLCAVTHEPVICGSHRTHLSCSIIAPTALQPPPTEEY